MSGYISITTLRSIYRCVNGLLPSFRQQHEQLMPTQPCLDSAPKVISEITLPKSEPLANKSVSTNATGISFSKSVIIDIHHARERLVNFYAEVLRDNNHAREMIIDGSITKIPDFSRATDKELADDFRKMELGEVLLEENPDCDIALVHVPTLGNVVVAERNPSKPEKAKHDTANSKIRGW